MEMLNCATVGCCLPALTVTNPCREVNQERKEDDREPCAGYSMFPALFFIFPEE